MCGINGFIQFAPTRSKEEMAELVHSMNEMIIHRGPDDEGLFSDEYCSLGMRRLSIIDLESGSQPIWNKTHTKMIVFNGELYNYRDLRIILENKGYSFSTKSDTEVALIAYDEWEEDCFDKLEGMFSFAIYDKERTEWIIVRDRVGEKPLYYYTDQSCFSFASELKSLLKTGLFEKEIDKESLSTFFQLTYIPAPRSIFKSVKKLMPGTFFRVSREGHIQEKRYWKLEPQARIADYQDYNTCKKELREKLFGSVERRMISDVPLGAFLSGGFDSSIVVGIMSRISNQRINTFNIAYKEKQFDESKLAQIVAKKNNTNHTELLLDWNEVIHDVDTVLNNIDEPYADSSLIATYAVSKMTKQHVTVALTGDAGDELFAGYNKYLGNYYGQKYNKIPGPIRKGVIEPLASALPKGKAISRKIHKVISTSQMSEYDRALWLMSLGFKSDELKQLCPGINVDTLSFVKDQFEEVKQCDIQARIQYVDFCTVLEGDMLTKTDRASMLASLETRVPMLDRDVIELAANIPTTYKIKGKERKIILKDTFRDLLPEELFSAPKHGFEVPIGKWLSEELYERLCYFASEDFIETQGLFSLTYINKVIEEHKSKKVDRSSELWAFFVFQNWYERVFVKNEYNQ